MKKITEADSKYDHLESKSTRELLISINREDHSVPIAVQKVIPSIEALTNAAFRCMSDGGRLFYIGSGTSGRLGIVDASECPPTYGVDHGLVIGLIAGGDRAIRRAVEKAEDDIEGGWADLKQHEVNSKDFVIGITASGTTPYVLGGIQYCNQNKIATGCITCNENTVLAREARYPIEVIVGPEFVTGSTRMKAGTAQKLILNMISSTLMIKLGKIKGNKMVDMQLNNNKLHERGRRMITEVTGLSLEQAKILLDQHGSVRKVLEIVKNRQAT